MKRITKRRLLIAATAAAVAVLLAGTGLFFHARHLGAIVHEKFAGKRWELPARIYARPLELYPSGEIRPEMLVRELSLLRYREADRVDGPGSFSRTQGAITLYTRSFRHEDGAEPARKVRLTLAGGRIDGIIDVETGAPAEMVRLDPALIASFYPDHNEDRILVKLEEVSPLLIQTLIAVEDRNFYRHHGIAPLSILRAFIANLKQLRTVQGGSTLTQQLVKNFFLTHRRTLKRKFDEAIMALILEINYDKDEILEAYLNEVYLGQQGDRAIHGFGLASRFYFGRPLEDLRPHETALLVGMLKGPSHYDPRRFPDRAAARRNLVLDIMAELKLIHAQEAEAAKTGGLGVIDESQLADTRFPAFLDLIRRQLLEAYREEDLRSEGLRIFTSFDPQVQFAAEAAVTQGLSALESDRNLPPDELEAGAIVLATGANEVLALVGGRSPRFHGFNRALDARRPIGSLIKPAIYLTALERPETYTLVSPVDDGMITIPDEQRGAWVPRNYDREYHGIVPLYEALVHSYNSATVRLGMGLGLGKVRETLTRMGFEREIPMYPASLLGVMEMSPLEAAQIYACLADGGFHTPIRSIRSVHPPEGPPLQRYPITVRQNFDPGPIYMLDKVLQAVTLEGTARSLDTLLERDLAPAGKTGTTNDLKDSWFAGFTGDRLAAVWVGRDDNRPCGLTGSAGALRIWADIMNNIESRPLDLPQPDTVTWVVVDPVTGMRTDADCDWAMAFPFIEGSAPAEAISCAPLEIPGPAPAAEPAEAPDRDPRFLKWLKEIF